MHEGGELVSGYNSALEQINAEKKAIQVNVVRLGKVTQLQNQKARVTFFGENTVSNKEYPYLAGYVPTVNDVVALLPQGDTYIILGKVTNEAPVATAYALQADLEKVINGTTKVKNAEKADTATSATSATSATNATNATNSTNATYASHLGNSTRYIEVDSTNAVLPESNNSYSLGSRAKSYKELHTKKWLIDDAYYTAYGVALNSINATGYHAELVPSSTGGTSLGSASNTYYNVYARNLYQNGSAVTTSDKRKKKNIKILADKFKRLLMDIRPVTYKYKAGESGRYHAGFIAQEVEQAMKDNNITSEEFAGLVIQPNGEYGLRYEEFIALQTAVIQEHEAKIKELEERLNGLQRSTNS